MGNIQELKQQNLLDVINILRKEKELSKQALARQMDVSSVSAHSFINELLDMNIVLSSGTSSPSHGRKASLFRLNPYYGFAVGIFLSSTSIITVAYDFTSKLISSFTLNIDKTPENELGEQIITQARLAIATHKAAYHRCLGIGVAMPAIVDSTSSTIRKIFHFHNFYPLNLKDVMQEALGVPIFIGNDNKLCLNAIKWSEDRFTNRPIAFIGVEEGVGCGVLINGKILQGSNFFAGEIGHLSVDLNGPLCSCGSRGCIEGYISEKGLIKQVVDHLNSLSDRPQLYNTENFNIQHVISLAQTNDFVHTTILKCCDYFSVLLEDIVKIYDPKEIIIECEYLKQLPEFFSYLSNKFQHSPWVHGHNYVLRLNKIENVYATGAAMTVLDNVYTNHPNNILLKFL